MPGNWDVLWSLSIEEVFYIGFPIVCLLTRRTAVLVPLLIVLALSLPLTHAALVDNEIWQEKAYLPGMAAIAMGVLGAIVAARCPIPRRGFAILLCIVGALGFAGILFIEDTLWNTLKDGCLLLLTVSIACLLVGLQWREQMGASKPLFGFGWLRSFGRLSYEIYLTHMFVVYAAVRLYKAWGSDKVGWGDVVSAGCLVVLAAGLGGGEVFLGLRRIWHCARDFFRRVLFRALHCSLPANAGVMSRTYKLPGTACVSKNGPRAGTCPLPCECRGGLGRGALGHVI